MKRTLLAALIGCASLISTTASASESESDSDRVTFGLVPAFRVGRHALTRETPDGQKADSAGSYIAWDLTGVAVLPGDRFALGANFELFYGSGSNPGGYPQTSLGYAAGPCAMLGITERFFLQARGQYVSAVDNESYDISGYRVGGGGTIVIMRGHEGDAALQIDYLRLLGKTHFPDGDRELTGSVLSFGLQFSFFSGSVI